MPNSAEMLEKYASMAVCSKILLSIEEGDRKTVEDIKDFLKKLIDEADKRYTK